MLTKSSFSRLVCLTLSALMVLSVLVAALPRSAQAAPLAVNCEETYVVKAGESIRRIAKDFDITVYRLAKANNLEYPYSVTTGQSLCIPETPEPSSNYKWTVTYSNEKIKIEGTGFKKQSPFFFKTRENDTSKWYKLGSKQSDRDGVLSVTFNTPKDLLKKTSLVVCLKDGLTDALVCKVAYRQ